MEIEIRLEYKSRIRGLLLRGRTALSSGGKGMICLCCLWVWEKAFRIAHSWGRRYLWGWLFFGHYEAMGRGVGWERDSRGIQGNQAKPSSKQNPGKICNVIRCVCLLIHSSTAQLSLTFSFELLSTAHISTFQMYTCDQPVVNTGLSKWHTYIQRTSETRRDTQLQSLDSKLLDFVACFCLWFHGSVTHVSECYRHYLISLTAPQITAMNIYPMVNLYLPQIFAFITIQDVGMHLI